MQFCPKCGSYYSKDYAVDHVYECYTQTTRNESGTATYRITLPGIYKLIELNAIDPNRAAYKLARYGLGKVSK